MRHKPTHIANVRTSSSTDHWGHERSNDSHKDIFFLDPGGYIHVTYQRDLLHNFNPDDSGVILGLDPDNMLGIHGSGTLYFLLPDGTLKEVGDVKYIPSCGRDLILTVRSPMGLSGISTKMMCMTII